MANITGDMFKHIERDVYSAMAQKEKNNQTLDGQHPRGLDYEAQMQGSWCKSLIFDTSWSYFEAHSEVSSMMGVFRPILMASYMSVDKLGFSNNLKVATVDKVLCTMYKLHQ